MTDRPSDRAIAQAFYEVGAGNSEQAIGWGRIERRAREIDAAAVNGVHCQNGDVRVCRASQRDGVICPDDSCDIDDGVRPTDAELQAARNAAAPKGERCGDCPPRGDPTDATRCAPCPLRAAPDGAQAVAVWMVRDSATGGIWFDENCVWANESDAIQCAEDMNDTIDDARFEAVALYTAPHSLDAEHLRKLQRLLQTLALRIPGSETELHSEVTDAAMQIAAALGDEVHIHA